MAVTSQLSPAYIVSWHIGCISLIPILIGHKECWNIYYMVISHLYTCKWNCRQNLVHTILQYRDRERSARIRCEPTPEVTMCGMRYYNLSTDTLQLSHPGIHHVTILEHHPAASEDRRVYHASCYGTLWENNNINGFQISQLLAIFLVKRAYRVCQAKPPLLFFWNIK